MHHHTRQADFSEGIPPGLAGLKIGHSATSVLSLNSGQVGGITDTLQASSHYPTQSPLPPPGIGLSAQPGCPGKAGDTSFCRTCLEELCQPDNLPGDGPAGISPTRIPLFPSIFVALASGASSCPGLSPAPQLEIKHIWRQLAICQSCKSWHPVIIAPGATPASQVTFSSALGGNNLLT